VKSLAPAEQAPKIDQHAEIIRKIEAQLAEQLEQPGGACGVPEEPDGSIVGESGSQHVGSELSVERDDLVHAQVGAAHVGIIRAAFQCDLIRVATFQWSAACSQVSFGEMFPEDPTGFYMHHPLSHRIGNAANVTSVPPSDGYTASVVEFLTNVHTWYNTQTAALLLEFKEATDVHGGNLLDRTIIPFITDVAHATHARSPLPALLFGGRALGMRGGQFIDVADRPHNDLWMTLAQAYLQSVDPLPYFAEEVFVQDEVSPIAGIWSAM
jgi:hypothetical protein